LRRAGVGSRRVGAVGSRGAVSVGLGDDGGDQFLSWRLPAGMLESAEGGWGRWMLGGGRRWAWRRTAEVIGDGSSARGGGRVDSAEGEKAVAAEGQRRRNPPRDPARGPDADAHTGGQDAPRSHAQTTPQTPQLVHEEPNCLGIKPCRPEARATLVRHGILILVEARARVAGRGPDRELLSRSRTSVSGRQLCSRGSKTTYR
jgi:hypothetical protein